MLFFFYGGKKNMDVIIYDILLDTQYAGCRRQIELKKGEANSKIFRIELCKGTEPIEIDPKEAMAIIRGCKEDGTVIVNPAKITNESKIEYEVGSQDTAAVGTTWYEVQVVAKDGESYKILYSAQFKAVVKDTLVEDGKITSSDEFGLLVDTITENKEWKENKDKELASWMEEREKEIDTKEKEHETKITENEKAHVELIYDNTLVFKETKIFTKAEDTTPEILDFNSEYIEKDCDAIEVINNDNSRVKIKIDDYNTIKTIGPGQTARVVLGDIEKYKINATNLFPGQESIDITKVTLKKYIFVNKIGSFFSNYAENELVQNDLFVERLAKNTASYLPSFMASYCASDPMFMSSMTEALPKDDGFMSKVGKRIESFIDQTLPKNDEFMTGVGKRIGSFWDGNCASQTAYALASNTASYLPSFMASYCASDSMFMSKMAEALPSDSTFINSVGRKMAKADSFCNELASSPPFGSAVLTNALVSLELSKYVPRTTTICGIPLTSHISPSVIADSVASLLPSTGSFMNNMAELLPSRDAFINNIAEKLPSRLGFFGIFQTITTPNESGKEYFKFEDYSIKGKYSINSDRNKINIPRKLLSIKVRGNFSANSCKNCKICGEVIDENNQIVFSNFDIFRVKAGSDANGLVTETQPFNAEYILNADLDDSSLGNKTLYIRFYVKYDTIAYFYNIGAWGDCSVTITEI